MVKVVVDAPALESEVKKVQAVVARGRSVMIDRRIAGPGEVVQVPETAMRGLRLMGFVTSSEEEQAYAERAKLPFPEPRPTVNGRDGSRIGGGPFIENE